MGGGFYGGGGGGGAWMQKQHHVQAWRRRHAWLRLQLTNFTPRTSDSYGEGLPPIISCGGCRKVSENMRRFAAVPVAAYTVTL